MRNNSDRVEEVQESETVQPQPPVPDLWAFPSGEVAIDLPTKGQFYPEGSPLKDAEYVTVRSLKTEEEEILSNQDLIKKGIAIDRMLQNIIVSPNFNVQDLYLADKNALLVGVRKRNFGQKYDVSFVCRSCGTSKPTEVDLDSVKINPPGTHMNDDGTFDVDIGEGYFAVCQMLTGKHIIEMEKAAEKRKKHRLGEEKPLLEQLKKMVVYFKVKKDEVEQELKDKHKVNEVIASLPVPMLRALRKGYAELIPSVDLSYHLDCGACGKESKVNIPFNANFFWPEQ